MVLHKVSHLLQVANSQVQDIKRKRELKMKKSMFKEKKIKESKMIFLKSQPSYLR